MTQKFLIYSIDDDQIINQILEARLLKSGYDARVFNVAKDLVSALRDKLPDLLILDLDLGAGGLSGFDLIEYVRLNLRSDIPIIVISSNSKSENVTHALEIGANDFLNKPAYQGPFEEKIARYLGETKGSRESASKLNPLPEKFRDASLKFQVNIKEVNSLGFVLSCSHLIKKGHSFWLEGNHLREILPSVTRLQVTVLGTALEIVENTRTYLLKVEIDSTQGAIVQELKNFLDLKQSQISNLQFKKL